MAKGQLHIAPALVLGPWVRHAVVVHVTPERAALYQVGVQQLGPAPRCIGGHEVGLIDHPRAPGLARLGALTSPARPAVLCHDLCKVLAELPDRAALYGLVYGFAQVVQQISLGRASHHKRAVMGGALNVSPALAGQVQFAPQEINLLLKLLAHAIHSRAGCITDVSHGQPLA